MAGLTVANKDPQEILDYGIDWTARLAGDTISSSSWEVSAGDVTIGTPSSTNTTTSTKVWVVGGTIDVSIVLTNRVVTAGGRTYDQSIKFKIKAK